MPQPEQTKSGPLYGRKWEIKIYKKGQNADSDVAMDVSLLRCVFKCQFNWGTAASLGTLIVYNMNAATEKEVITEGFQFSIFAGYELGQYGEIFTGDIVQVVRNRENGVDYRLEMIAMRANSVFPVNHVRASIAANSEPREIAKQVAKQAKNPIQIGTVSSNISKQPLPRGKILFGKPEKYLRDICEWCNGWFQISPDKKLNIHTLMDEIPENMTLYLTPETGLVGTPKYTDGGISIKMLIEPRIRVSSPFLIKLDNSIIQRSLINISPNQTSDTNTSNNTVVDQKSMFDQDGEYQVLSYTHSGDTYGDEWFTEAIALSRNGKAKLVNIMENATQTTKG